MLANWEIPLLKASGYEFIFTPQYVPSNPVFTSGSVDELTGISNLISIKDLDTLSQQNWYEKISDEAATTANENFEIAFVTADPNQVINVLKAFKGRIVIRLFGLDSGRTYSQLYKQSYSPSEWIYFMKNINRIIFASGYREILENEESWICEKSVYLPIGLPDAKEVEWIGDLPRLFAVVPRIEPGTYFSNMLNSHFRMAGRSPIVIGGRQHLVFKDSRILGALEDSDFYSEMLRSRGMLYASREISHVHYHPIEAMQSSMPVVFYKDSLLASLLGRGLIGCVKNLNEAKLFSRNILEDESFARTVGKTQREAVKKLERENLGIEFAQGIKEIENMQFFSRNLVSQTLILCSEDHEQNKCASKNDNESIFIKIDPRNSNIDYLHELEIIMEETTLDNLRKINLNSHRYSRIYNSYSDKVMKVNTTNEYQEIILCGLTLPITIIANTEVSRYLNSSIIQELMKEPYNPSIEQLRYSLASLDGVTVTNNEDKNYLAAFSPVNPKLIRVESNE